MKTFLLVSFVVISIISYFAWPKQVSLEGLKSRRILITGGGSGIGEEMAKIAFNEGAHVTITGRRASRLSKVCKSINSQANPNRGKCDYVEGDMSIKEDTVKAITEAVKIMGGLDSLILNHVWGITRIFEDLQFDEIEDGFLQTYRPNVLGNMWLIHKALPYLKESAKLRGNRSHILHVSSISITYGVPKLSFYASSKLAMNGFIDGVRMELGPKSQVSLTTANVGSVLTDTFKDSLIKPTVELEAAMAVDKCARLLLEYMVTETREVMMPLVDNPFPISGYIPWMFPGLMEGLLRYQYNITDAKQAFLKDLGGKPLKDN